MPVQADVSKHYTHGGLVEAIRAGIVSLGKEIDTVTVDDLAPVDEFHIGGRRASAEILDQLSSGSLLRCTFSTLDAASAAPHALSPADTGAGSSA
jgi:hypothetical protein